jgi:heat shock protein HslJ
MSYLEIKAQPLSVRDGRYAGESFVPGGASRVEVTVFDELAVFGDLAGDGSTLAVVPIVEQAGGSGSWTYLAAVDSNAHNVATAALGDRVELVALGIENGRIHVTLVAHGPKDPMCCPSQWIEQEWAIIDDALVTGTVSEPETVALEQLSGSRWVLERLGDMEDGAAAAIDIAFDAGRISGSAGCNNYFADFEDGEPGRVSIGPIGATRRACEMPLMDRETLFLEALGVVNRYRFSMGRLVLLGTAADGSTVYIVLTRMSPAAET